MGCESSEKGKLFFFREVREGSEEDMMGGLGHVQVGKRSSPGCMGSSSICWDAGPVPEKTTGAEGSKLGGVPWCQVADDLEYLALCLLSNGELFRFCFS